MPHILVHLSVQDGKIKRSSLEVLTRCRELAESGGHELGVVIAHPRAGAFVDQAGRFGATRAFVAEDTRFERHLNVHLLSALQTAALRLEPILFAFASTEAVKDVLGALAVRLGAAVLPDVSSFELIDGGVETVRPVMAAKVLSRQRASADTVLVSVRSGSYDASESPARIAVERLDVSFGDTAPAPELKEVVMAPASGVDLSEADVVVAAGRGVRDEEGKRLAEELAALFGGATGATRAVVENGLYPATAQIGQTGKVVSPTLYFALGVSGAVQHVAGMQNSKTVVAINKDPDAPIFQYATYGIAGDLYEVVPRLIDKLKDARTA